jgi:hypothetical protein
MKNAFRNVLATILTTGSMFSADAAPPETSLPLTPAAKAALRLYVAFEHCSEKKMAQPMAYTASERERGEQTASRYFIALERHQRGVAPELKPGIIDKVTRQIAAESRCERDMGITIDAVLTPYDAVFKAGHSIDDIHREMMAQRKILRVVAPK